MDAAHLLVTPAIVAGEILELYARAAEFVSILRCGIAWSGAFRCDGWCEISILLKLKAMPATPWGTLRGDGRQHKSGVGSKARAWIIKNPVRRGLEAW